MNSRCFSFHRKLKHDGCRLKLAKPGVNLRVSLIGLLRRPANRMCRLIQLADDSFVPRALRRGLGARCQRLQIRLRGAQVKRQLLPVILESV